MESTIGACPAVDPRRTLCALHAPPPWRVDQRDPAILIDANGDPVMLVVARFSDRHATILCEIVRDVINATPPTEPGA
ncbi:MAG: hypothetical protein AB7O44_27520 [Hyphomicrobiaceae bacterium]